MSRKGRIIVVVAIVIAAAFVLLPAGLVSEPVLTRLKQEVARHFQARVDTASCSLGWLQGLRCEQVQYVDPGKGFHCQAPLLTTDKGLLSLVAAPSYLGEISIDQPTCTLQPPLPGDLTSLQGNDSSPTEVSPAPGSPVSKPSWWERIALRLKIRHGQALFEPHGQPARPLIRQVDLASSLAAGTVTYDLSFLSPHQQGRVQAKGMVHLPQVDQTTLETLVAQADVEIDNLELSDFFELAAARSALPRGRGLLNATARINANGIAEFEAQGETTVQGLQLNGGVLGEDHPQVDHLRLTFKGSRRQAEGWRLNALTLQSDPIQLNASGGFDTHAVTLAVKGHVNLPAMAAQLPHLLRIHQQTTIVEGTTGFSLSVNGNPDALNIRADCRAELLRIVHDRQPYAWSSPLALEIEADYGREQSSLRALRLHTPFFEAQGAGGVDGFSLRGGGDLDRMSLELKKVVALDVHAKGRLEVAATSSRNGESGYRLESQLAIHDFSLLRGKQTILPPHPLLLTGTFASPSLFTAQDVFQVVSLEAKAWPGTVSLRSEGTAPPNSEQGKDYVLKGTVDLGRLGDAVRGLHSESRWPVLKGSAQFEAAGEWRDGSIAVQRLNGSIDRLNVTGGQFSIQEPRVVFGLGGIGEFSQRPLAVQGLMVVEDWQDYTDKVSPRLHVDTDRRRLDVRRLTWASAKAVLEGDGLIEDWRLPERQYAYALRGEVDGSLLGDLVKAGGLLPADLAVQGRARGEWTLTVAPDEEPAQAFSLEIASLAVLRGKKVVATDPLLTCNLRVQDAKPPAKDLKITDFRLQAAPFAVAAAGLFRRTDALVLELRGQITPQYARLVPLLHSYVGRNTVIVGNLPGSFQLSLPLAMPLQSDRVSLIAELPVENLRLGGINWGAMTLPLELHRDKLRLRMESRFDDGRVTLAPLWDLSLPQPLLTIPANTLFLSDVAVTPPLLDNILSTLHPLFGGLAQAQGAVDLRVNQFSMPVGQKAGQGPVFTVTVAVDRLKFLPTEPLRELLGLNGYNQEWYRCQEKEIQCEGKNGRVRCQPAHLLAGDDAIAFKGEISRDRRLQYALQLPLGRQLAEKAQLNVEDEPPVIAEINGTVQEPVFDAQAFIAGLSRQLGNGTTRTQPKEMESAQPSANP